MEKDGASSKSSDLGLMKQLNAFRTQNLTPTNISLYASFTLTFILFLVLVGIGTRGLHSVMVSLAIGLTSFFIFRYSIQNFIYSKIKIIYKIIYTHKAQKLDDAVQKHIDKNDPLQSVYNQVNQWSNDKSDKIVALEQMEEYRKEFIGNVSHELKTPIFNIQGYIYTILDGAIEDRELTIKFLNKAAKSADRLESLVADLMTISQLESQAVELDFSRFDLVDQIKDIFDSLEMRAKNNSIKLTFKRNIPQCIVEADKKKIRQVLVNLIDNSIKYGRDGGVTAVNIFDMDDIFLVEVSDDGEGIEERHLSRLFERFYRIDKARSREHGGTGLGLAIVKHIIEAHDQTINVRSSVGLGSTFGFTLKKA